jgi:arylsulfatase A
MPCQSALTHRDGRSRSGRQEPRRFVALAVAVALACLGPAAAPRCLAAGSRAIPNIIFIMADDLGYAELGCYGQRKIKTPNIDNMAAEGMRFTQHYTSAPVCAPARCSLMTGKHGGHALVRDNSEQHPAEYLLGDSFGGQYPLPAGTVTIARVLQQAGYVTGAFGKWGLGGVGTSGDPLNQGFDRFFGYNCQRHAHNLYPKYLVDNRQQRILEGNTNGVTGQRYAPQQIADEMLAFIREHHDRPFFVYYPTVIPHLALQVPEQELLPYKGLWPETPYTGTSYQPHPTPKAAYAAMISFFDKQVGRLMQLLKELNLDDRTIVFLTSDNGTTHLKDQVDAEFFQSVGPLRGLKGSVYEGGIRVPMIVRWPGQVAPHSESDLLSAHYDALATILDVVGQQPPADTDGISYLPTLLSHNDAQPTHPYLFWDFAGYGGQLAVRMGRWKGVQRNLRQNPDAPLELYDLSADLGETTDVAAQQPDVVERIRRILLEARVRPEVETFRFGRYPD